MSDEWLRFILAALACFRVTELLVVDDGPGDIFLKLRERVGVYDSGIDDRPRTQLGRIFECPFCLGLWLALPLALWTVGLSPEVVVAWPAIAGAQSVLQKLAGRVNP